MNKLFIHLSTLAKPAENAQIHFPTKMVVLLSSKAFIQPNNGTASSFSSRMSEAIGTTGKFKAVSFNASGIHNGLAVDLEIEVAHLEKGTKVSFFSASPPSGFKSVTIEMYDPDDQRRVIHAKQDVPDKYSVALTWPW
jgi:hypothetical protein